MFYFWSQVLEEDKEETETKNNTKKGESSLKLTEDIEKPTGIGSFGFADKKDSDKDKNGQEKTDNNEQSKPTNYFSQKVNPGDKLGFVFGGSAASSGFSSIKNTNEAESLKDAENVEKLDGDDGGVEGFPKTSSHEKLLEQASEYEKSHNDRQHFEEIDKFTGEEGEQHVLQARSFFSFWWWWFGYFVSYFLVSSCVFF